MAAAHRMAPAACLPRTRRPARRRERRRRGCRPRRHALAPELNLHASPRRPGAVAGRGVLRHEALEAAALDDLPGARAVRLNVDDDPPAVDLLLDDPAV